MAWTPKERKALGRALLFLSPNLAGFLVFVLVPLLVSLVMAFTNWDLKQHNIFHEGATPRFIGLDNFMLLVREDEFLRYLGNTLIMMLGIPFGMAGSLAVALMLDAGIGGRTRADARRIASAGVLLSVVAVLATAFLMVMGLGATALTLVVVTLAGMMLVGGSTGGAGVYRTVFLLPSFTSGVAVFLLWKKIYNPVSGPLNNALDGPLSAFGGLIQGVPDVLVQAGLPLGYGLAGFVAWRVCRRLALMWDDGEVGAWGVGLGAGGTGVAVALGWGWSSPEDGSLGWVALSLLTLGAAAGLVFLLGRLPRRRSFACPRAFAMGSALSIAGGALVIQASVMGLALWAFALPAQADAGLAPPQWLVNYHWAKPALILMGLWAAIGSNNMLLYLAGLQGVSRSLYDVADIDGAKGFTRFWHVTWPQLAPVTFFILVMSVISGLQGGFEMARTMTAGGPAGSTTTLAYYVFAEGFETGRLGFASAVAWAMFALVATITAFNWKFGGGHDA